MQVTLKFLPLLLAPVLVGSCLVQRTVTDANGNLIYQEPEVHTPFESAEKEQAEIMKKERELGWP